MIQAAAWIVVSYLLGSIPAAYIAARSRGIDLRRHGSGNLGATNAIRVLGMRTGLAVFAFDMAKGGVPVWFFPRLLPATLLAGEARTIFAIACGVAAIIGHTRPIYLRFGKGGKGVATAAGVFLALAPLQAILTLVVFAVVVLCSGYVSLGSLVATSTLPVLLALTIGLGSPVFIISVAVMGFVFWTHRLNIGRLRRGEENRFGRRRERPRGSTVLAIGIAVAAAMVVARRFG